MTLEVFSPLIEAAKQLENCVNLGNNFQHHVQVSGRVLMATLYFPALLFAAVPSFSVSLEIAQSSCMHVSN